MATTREDAVGTAASGDALFPALARLPGHLLWRAHALVSTLLTRLLPDDVDVHAYATLIALSRAEALSQRELAGVIDVSCTTMVTVADSLEDRGLVRRVRNRADRRSYALTRTRQGASAVRRWRPHVDRLDARLTARLSAAERTRLRQHLLVVLTGQLSPDTPDELLGSVAFLVTRAHLRLHRVFLRALEPLAIEPRHFGALVAVTDDPPVAQGELARRLGVSPTTVVQLVDDMEARGLVARRRNPADRRSYLLHPQPRAGSIVARAHTVRERVVHEELGALGDARLSDLVRLLQRVLAGS